MSIGDRDFFKIYIFFCCCSRQINGNNITMHDQGVRFTHLFKSGSADDRHLASVKNLFVTDNC